ncbi:MAG: PAS domain-containing sensor histidine kinase [Chloroflexota bacterium]
MNTAIRITLSYLIFGFLWIILREPLIMALFGANSQALSLLDATSGLWFIILTSLGLFVLIYCDQRKIRTREADFELLFKKNPHPMGVYDPTTMRFIEVNDIAIDVYGYTRHEFLQIKLKDLYLTEDVGHLIQFLKGSPDFDDTTIWRHQRKNGEIFYVTTTGAPITYQGRDVVFVTAVDISERVQLENERMKSHALHSALEKEVSARTNRYRLASIISHDLRTPLTTIMASASTLERYEHRLDSEQRIRHYGRIVGQARLINDEFEAILLWLRSDDKVFDFQPVTTDIVSFVQSLLDNFRNPITLNRLQFNVKQVTVSAEIDHRLFARVVTNLVSNALKYSDSLSCVEVLLADAGQMLILTVRDDGIGIPLDNQNNLFDAFYRADNVMNVQGTGLGLSIAKEIVELHHGTIHVESVEGQGSTFTVTFPKVQPQS